MTLKEYDAFIIPFADINTNKKISTIAKLALGTLGIVMLKGITQLEVDKGNVITAHRVDGGYALTQRGGSNDDRVFIRLLLTGPSRYITREYLAFLADQKTAPLSFLSRAVRLAKCQIESLKVIENSERRGALVVHVIFRQLRTFQDNLIASSANMVIAALIGADEMENQSLYDTRHTSGGTTSISELGSFLSTGTSTLLERFNDGLGRQ